MFVLGTYPSNPSIKSNCKFDRSNVMYSANGKEATINVIDTNTIQPNEELINDFGKSEAYWTALNKPVKVKAQSTIDRENRATKRSSVFKPVK